MDATSEIPALSSLESVPYLTADGLLPETFQSQIGVYAIFDQDQRLQFVGYSRDIFLSLQQHLVRRPQSCYWVKVKTIDRPNRTVLESIRDAWIAENGSTPIGNGAEQADWTQPINAKARMSEEEQVNWANAMDGVSQIKVLKQAARRVEAEVMTALGERGVKMQIRFNPKLKEEGLLDLK